MRGARCSRLVSGYWIFGCVILALEERTALHPFIKRRGDRPVAPTAFGVRSQHSILRKAVLSFVES